MNHRGKILVASFFVGLVLVVWTPWKIHYQGVHRSSNGGKFEYDAYYKRHPFWQKDAITEPEMESKLPYKIRGSYRFEGFVGLKVDLSRLAVEYSVLIMATGLGLYLEKAKRREQVLTHNQ